MSAKGFMITRLALTGPGKLNAELLFRNGLNVITGPSDTGKTFAFECIDFMLGASTPPKGIPEADGYDTVFLDIFDRQNKKKFSLTRSLKGGPFKLSIDDKENRVLGEKHSANDEDTVSCLLLAMANLQNKVIRKNIKGETRSFSFRDVAHLSIISESDIIKKGSPLHSGQFIKKTEEQSAYRFLLSGIDDASIVQTPVKKSGKKFFEAKEEVLKELIGKILRKIEEKQIDADLPTLTDQRSKIEQTIREVTDSLNEIKESVVSHEEARRSAWTYLKQVESRLEVLSELQSRFSLLHEQYKSDISRLQAISEAALRLGEMNLDYCPVCGASSEVQDRNHQECQTDPSTVAESCNSEVSRIQALVIDLDLTRDEIKHETEELNTKNSKAQIELKKAQTELQERLNPSIKKTIGELRLHQEKRDHIQLAISLIGQKNEYEELLDKLKAEATGKSERSVFADVGTHYKEAFSQKVQERLAAWHFPELGRVTFDSKDWDIIISGRSRSSHGKGVRAVTHAAFTLSLLRYCLDNDFPHSGVVLIDSPLVVYKEPDVDENNFSKDVKGAFFRDLAQSFQDAQVIIIENEEPPDDLASSGAANIIKFTKTSQGRSGFIPTKIQGGRDSG